MDKDVIRMLEELETHMLVAQEALVDAGKQIEERDEKIEKLKAILDKAIAAIPYRDEQTHVEMQQLIKAALYSSSPQGPSR